MVRARSAYVLLLLGACVNGAWAQTFTLKEETRANDCNAYRIALKLEGEMSVTQENKPIKLKLSAVAEHQYREKILAIQQDGPLTTKAARLYDDARAVISVDGMQSQRRLRPDRGLIVAQRPMDALLCYSPTGALTREEIETVSEHFDTMALAGLLPTAAAALNETWKPANRTVQALCLFEGLVANDVTCKLAEVKDNQAQILVSGTAKGIELGAQATVTIDARVRFDLNLKRLTQVEWKQQDVRDQGPASPAVTVESRIQVTRTSIEEPKELGEVALASVPSGFDVPAQLTMVSLRDAKNRFELNAARDWQVVSQSDNHLVLRLLERGEFIAQATVTPWQAAEPGQHVDPKVFREQMLSAPGWTAEEVIQEGEMPNPSQGRYVYRLTARGEMEGVKVIQCFYLVASPKGDQAILAVTLRQSHVNKLGAKDLVLVDGLDFPKR